MSDTAITLSTDEIRKIAAVAKCAVTSKKSDNDFTKVYFTKRDNRVYAVAANRYVAGLFDLGHVSDCDFDEVSFCAVDLIALAKSVKRSQKNMHARLNFEGSKATIERGDTVIYSTTLGCLRADTLMTIFDKARKEQLEPHTTFDTSIIATIAEVGKMIEPKGSRATFELHGNGAARILVGGDDGIECLVMPLRS